MLWSDSLLTGKRILITGASSGIGRSCAILCSQLGAEIIACGRDEKRLSQTISALSGEGHLSLAFELSDESQIETSILALKGSSPISGFIHCAGVERTNPLRTICMKDFSEMFKTNVASAVSILRCVMKPGLFNKTGISVVLMSSMRGLQGEKGNIEYSSTKSALYALTKSAAKELAAKLVRVNCVSPSMVQTEMYAHVQDELDQEVLFSIEKRHLLGIPKPEDVANMVVFLVSDLSRFVSGANFIVDSGYTIS